MISVDEGFPPEHGAPTSTGSNRAASANDLTQGEPKPVLKVGEQAAASASKVVLEFKDVDLAESRFSRAFQAVSFRILEGELVHVQVDRLGAAPGLASASLGLIAPVRGQIAFEQADWRTMSDEARQNARRQTGRVFSREAWISNLNILENVILSQRYHALTNYGESVSNADAVAVRLGLSKTPRERANSLSHSTLRVAQWIRALLNHPRLLVLEDPLLEVDAESARRLVELTTEHRAQGCAVLWLSFDETLGVELPRAKQFEAVGDRVLARN